MKQEKVVEYALGHDVDKTAAMTAAGVTGSKIDYNVLSGGGVKMCTLFEAFEAEDIIETRLALSETDVLQRL